jgi:hypothetical protein
MDLARRLTAPIGLACPHQPPLPPPVSPAPSSLACPDRPRLPLSASLAPVGLACPHGDDVGSVMVLGIGLRLWQSALGFPSLSFIYKSIVFLLFGSTDNSSSSLLLHHLLVSTGYEPGAELNSTPTISICLSSAPVPVDRANISLCLSFLLCLPALD